MEHLNERRHDERFSNLHSLIESLRGNNFNLFKESFIESYRELNKLEKENIIDNKEYREYSHVLNDLVTIYININESIHLIYQCLGCDDYFLSMGEIFLEERIKINNSLKDYSSSGFCSIECIEKIDETFSRKYKNVSQKGIF